MSPDPVNPGNPPAAGPATVNPATGPVVGTDPNYPQYAVEFSGGNVPATAPILVTGPHTHTFFLQQGGGQVTVSLTRNPSDGLRPNLSIKLS